MSIVKKSNSWTVHEAHKNKLHIRRLKYNGLNFEVIFEGPPNYSKTYFKNIFIFVNLLHNLAV